MKQDEIVLASGCFWGAEDLLRQLPGIISTEVGYTGGLLDNATYIDVREGTTGHAESVRIVFDADTINLAQVLQFFFKMHDPTTVNRQGNDVGTQYRSAIFYSTDEQKRVAAEEIARVNASGKWKNPVVTQVVPARAFWRAEDYHQKYLIKNPSGYTCHWVRD